MSRGMGYDVFPVTARALQSPSRASGIPVRAQAGTNWLPPLMHVPRATVRFSVPVAPGSIRSPRANRRRTADWEDLPAVGQAPRQAPSCPRTVVLHGSVLPCGCAHHLRLYYRPANFPRRYAWRTLTRGNGGRTCGVGVPKPPEALPEPRSFGSVAPRNGLER